MGLFELILIAIGLSMDAFAVSICKGLSVQKVKKQYYFIIGLWFGGFQALMPFLGYLLGSTFAEKIASFDHWIAFLLLAFIGVNMIRESMSKEEEKIEADFSVKTMFIMAVATSIDALAVGVSFALLPNVNIYEAVALIGVITFTFSGVGLKIGNLFGSKYKSKAELCGGIILVGMGIKILIEHMLG